MKKAFTLLESLTVISIMCLLAALLSPALLEAKRAAKVSGSTQHLRQLHLGILLYMNEYDLHEAKDRPPYGYVYGPMMTRDSGLFISPCGINQELDGNSAYLSSYAYWVQPNLTPTYFDQYRENSMLFTDQNCNPPGVFDSPFAHKRGVGITFGGQLINHFKTGDGLVVEWWTSRP